MEKTSIYRDMKNRIFLAAVVCMFALISGCGSASYSEIGHKQTATPQVANINVHPETVNPGATVVFAVDLAKAPEAFMGGTIIVTDSLGNSYEGELSNVMNSSNSFSASITLSPLVPAGELLLQVFVLDVTGNSSDSGFVTLTVL